jgi:hypothetical protein
MAEVQRTAASLRFHGDDLDPEDISRTLGASPTLGRKKGGIWYTPKGKEMIARTGYWSLSAAEETPADLDQQLTKLFSGLSDDVEAFRKLAARFKGNVFVGLFLSGFNEGLSLSPTILDAIGQRGLVLDLDIYSGTDNHTESD